MRRGEAGGTGNQSGPVPCSLGRAGPEPALGEDRYPTLKQKCHLLACAAPGECEAAGTRETQRTEPRLGLGAGANLPASPRQQQVKGDGGGGSERAPRAPQPPPPGRALGGRFPPPRAVRCGSQPGGGFLFLAAEDFKFMFQSHRKAEREKGTRSFRWRCATFIETLRALPAPRPAERRGALGGQREGWAGRGWGGTR